MDFSIFWDDSKVPTEKDLTYTLGSMYKFWVYLKKFVHNKYEDATDEWNYLGRKYGWNFRIRNGKKVIMYFLPRHKYFKVAFVFGRKSVDKVFNSNESNKIKVKLESSKIYAEGHALGISVIDKNYIPDIERLIEIKIRN